MDREQNPQEQPSQPERAVRPRSYVSKKRFIQEILTNPNSTDEQIQAALNMIYRSKDTFGEGGSELAIPLSVVTKSLNFSPGKRSENYDLWVGTLQKARVPITTITESRGDSISQTRYIAKLHEDRTKAVLIEAFPQGSFKKRSYKRGEAETVTKISELSEREIEVLTLASYGLKNLEIAALLGVTVKTVEAHKEHAQVKLEVTSFLAVIRRAIQEGFIKLEDLGKVGEKDIFPNS